MIDHWRVFRSYCHGIDLKNVFWDKLSSGCSALQKTQSSKKSISWLFITKIVIDTDRSGSRAAATSKMELFVTTVHYYHKVLHLGCCSSPRSASGYKFLKDMGMNMKRNATFWTYQKLPFGAVLKLFQLYWLYLASLLSEALLHCTKMLEVKWVKYLYL